MGIININININKVLYHVLVPLVFFYLLSSSDSVVHARYLSRLTKPDPNNAAATARWVVSLNSWGVLNTISIDLGGAPFGNVVSFSDGLPKEGSGIPYFYLTALDPTARNAFKDQRASFTVSEYPIGTCGQIDPENPTCSKITLTGKLKLVDEKSKEAEFAKNALFAKHPEMKGWPQDHDFQVFKLEIEDIFLIDWFGGPKPLTVEQYLHPHMYRALIPGRGASSNQSSSWRSFISGLLF
uniref:CREG-like beta-barrel domain-containing protein n=1 Tax=Lotus japonicus TaxID=34305 RepID=I3S4I1_LOTJA|nr:unknown [Lotus japonicus]